MKKVHFLSFLVLFSLSLVSFRCNCYPDFIEKEGKIINVYPDWCCLYEGNAESNTKIHAEYGRNPAFGFSSWLDWQTEGKKMWQFVDRIGKVRPENFQGKFRVMTYGQRFSLLFSDVERSKLDFFAYIGDYKEYHKDRIINIDTDVDEFEFDCYLRIGNSFDGFTNGCTESNKGKVIMKKNPSNEKEFSYTFYINHEPIIDITMKNQAYEPPAILIDSDTLVSEEWLPKSFKELLISDSSAHSTSYGKSYLNFVYKKNNLYIQSNDYCFEGYSLRAIDKENKKISFNLLDARESDLADYFEIHILDSNWSSDPDAYGTSTRMKGTLGYYKEGQETPIKFFDEVHSEIRRRDL